MSSSPSKYTNDQLHELAKQHAKKAVEYDFGQDFGQAYFHYMVPTLINENPQEYTIFSVLSH